MRKQNKAKKTLTTGEYTRQVAHEYDRAYLEVFTSQRKDIDLEPKPRIYNLTHSGLERFLRRYPDWRKDV